MRELLIVKMLRSYIYELANYELATLISAINNVCCRFDPVSFKEKDIFIK